MKADKRKLWNSTAMCGLCGKEINLTELYTKEITIDHIVPKSEGGSNRYENLQLAHRFCNQRKAVQPDYFEGWEL